MMEGTAASSSMAVPTGRRIQPGASSVRKKATPNAKGTAIIKASTELTMVP